MGNHKVIQTLGASRAVRYSMYDFIEAVKTHSVLWDRDNESFHNREIREAAWHNIGRQLCSDFDNTNELEKQKIAQTLSKRWKNTRDSFCRSHRYRQQNSTNTGDYDDGGGMAARSYIYEKEMSFLLKTKIPSAADTAASASSLNAIEDENTKEACIAATPKKDMIQTRKRKRGNQASTNNGSVSVPSTNASMATAKATIAKKRKEQQAAIVESRTKGNISRSRRSSDSSNMNIESDICNTSIESSETQLQSSTNTDQHILIDSKETTTTATLSTTKTVEHKNDPVVAAAAVTPKFSKVAVAPNCAETMAPFPTTTTTIDENHPTCMTKINTIAAASSAPAIMTAIEEDHDQAFFDSIKPLIRNWSVDKKLDFQIEVLKLLRVFRTQ